MEDTQSKGELKSGQELVYPGSGGSILAVGVPAHGLNSLQITGERSIKSVFLYSHCVIVAERRSVPHNLRRLQRYRRMGSDVSEERQLVPAANKEIAGQSGMDILLGQIRPQWQAKNLIQRVKRLLPVDASSACQRIFNASVHDLREKIVIAGVDIASEVAKTYRLPPISQQEDVEHYSVSRTLDLAYRMGLLSRPEWHRMLRCYDIRKDLEHEDDEYEAGIEDCFYVFKTCIDVVLAKDPVHLLKLTDVKAIVEEPRPTVLSEALLEDYAAAPGARQLEIYRFLLSISLDQTQPDIVRQNSFSALGALEGPTHKQVILAAAAEFVQRLGRKPLSLREARVANAAGVLPYLKKAHLAEFFRAFIEKMDAVGCSFRSHEQHGELLRNLIEVGGLDYCTDEFLEQMVEWLILCYIGEPGGYGDYGVNRRVFYSNTGAPIALEILATTSRDIEGLVQRLERSSVRIRRSCQDEYVARRFQRILDELES